MRSAYRHRKWAIPGLLAAGVIGVLSGCLMRNRNRAAAEKQVNGTAQEETDHALSAEELRRIEEDEAAFRILQNYSVEDAYGMTDLSSQTK